MREMKNIGAQQREPTERLSFLLGDWNLEYNVPKSNLSEPATGRGTGTFKRALNNKYVYFDYSCSLTTSLTTGQAQAHGVFAWDQKAKAYRYWWFEDSGSFSEATGDFVNDGTLLLKWHDTGLIQTFKRVDGDKIILKMEDEVTSGKHELVLEVVFTRENK